MSTASDARVFTAKREDGSEVKLSIRKPTTEERERADLERSVVFNRSLLAGLPTRQTMVRRLRKVGLWTTEQEEELTKARTEGIEIEVRLAKGEFDNDPDAKAKAQERFIELNAELESIVADASSMLAETCDQKADDAFDRFLMVCVTEVPSTGKRLWGTVDACVGESDMQLLSRVAHEYTTFINDLPSQWVEETAEAEGEDKGEGTSGETLLPPEPPVPSPSIAASEGEDEPAEGEPVEAV